LRRTVSDILHSIAFFEELIVDAANFDETLTAFRDRKPFQPFTIALVDGDRYEIDFPQALVIRNGVAVYLSARGVPVIFDHESVSQVIGDLMGRSPA
jgi:hypothetical protein